jgi:hypothetical protein
MTDTHRVKVTRVAYVETWVEVEASDDEDACDKAIQDARKIPLSQWTATQSQGVEDEFDAEDVEPL